MIRGDFIRFLLLAAALLPLQGLWSQVLPGDSLMEFNVLGAEDIDDKRKVKEEVVFGPNRVPENTDELAQLTYVITRDEILRNGYASLNDVLRNIPGMRTSDPGSALMGESFLMRGLLGNTYTKILINGMPFTPSTLPGFPLSSQLPIKQAERIEITFGPATTVYGNDAMAGVINIVMSEIDKPLEVIANGGFGQSARFGTNEENTGANELHLLLGGKLGKDKNVLHYQFFGSSKKMKDRNLLAPDSLLRVDPGILAGGSRFVPRSPEDSLLPLIEDFGQESRLLGMQLDFRGFRFSVSNMSRAEHSSVGGHPQEYAYHNPFHQVRDEINSLRLQYNATPGDFWLQTNVGLTSYDLDENSSFEGVEHPIADDVNFMYAKSLDFQVEQLANYQKGRLSITAGANLLMKSGVSILQYLKRPFTENDLETGPMGGWVVLSSRDDNDDGDLVAPYIPYQQYSFVDFGGFAQLSYRGDLFNRPNFYKFNAGLRADFQDVGDFVLSPKLDLFLNLSDKLKFRSLFATGFRRPSPFYNYSNFVFSQDMQEPEPSLKQVFRPLQEEHLTNIEGGLSWKPVPDLSLNFHTFYQALDNTLFLNLNFPANNQDTTEAFEMGFENKNSLSTLQGFKVSAQFERLREVRSTPLDEQESRSWLEEESQQKGLIFLLSAQYYIGKEAIELVDTIESFRGVPDLMAQAQVTWLQKDGWRFTALGSYTGAFVSNLTRVNREIEINHSGTGFVNLDLIFGKSLGRLDAYVRIENVTGSVGKGISHDFISAKRLAYTPMRGRFATLGLTFKID